MLSLISVVVGISTRCTAPSPQSPIGSTQGARAALVARFEILVGAEIALALHQAEAARIVVDEGADLEVGRIVERAPDLLAAAVLDREAVGIVHLGAEIVDAAAIVGAEEIHAGERREPDLLDLHARKQRRLDVVDRGFAGPDGEAIGGRRAFAVEQRVHDDRVRALRRPLDPEGAEVREIPRPSDRRY